MESMIRNIVKEEISLSKANERVCSSTRMEPQNHQHQSKPSSSSGRSNSGTAPPKRHGSMSGRLTNLLNKLNGKTEQADGDKIQHNKKNVKIQLRWLRCDEEGKELIKPAKGGGLRFAIFAPGEDCKFSNLLLKALNVFFPDGESSFHDQQSNVYASITDSSEREMELSENVLTYMNNQGLFPSRACFYLKTQPNEEKDYFDETDDAELMDPNPELSRKRSICNDCGSTYFDKCIKCDQDKAYQLSLAMDKQKGQFSQITQSDDDTNSESTDTENPSSLSVLRKRRLKALETTSLSEKIGELASKYITEDNVVKFSIRRKCLYSDMMQKMDLFFKDKALSKVSVEFMSFGAIESCVDTGGPSRELFSLLYEKSVGIILHGPIRRHSFLHDLSRMASGEYFKYGQCVALSILSDYGPPHQFCKGLACYLLDFPECHCSLEDVPDPDIQLKLKEVETCNEEQRLKVLIENFPERFDCGYLKNKVDLQSKNEFIKKIAHHCIISSSLEEINDFKRGLSSCGVLQALAKHGNESLALLTYSDNLLDTDDLKKVLFPKFSTEESQLSLEEDIIYNLYNFLDEVKNNRIKPITSMVPEQLEQVERKVFDYENKVIRATDVAKFLTGGRFFNKDGKIDIIFRHGNVRRMSVSACNSEIYIPVIEAYYGKEFTSNIIFDIVNSPGFGCV